MYLEFCVLFSINYLLISKESITIDENVQKMVSKA